MHRGLGKLKRVVSPLLDCVNSPSYPERIPLLSLQARIMVEGKMNPLAKWALVLLGLLSIILNIVLIGIHSSRAPKCSRERIHPLRGRHDDRTLVFADLTREEYMKVQQYLLKQKDLAISTSQITKPSENFLFLIELSLPKKAEVLAYLDEKGSKPVREATAVVFHGAKNYIKEYVVGPLDNPTYHRDVTKERYQVMSPLMRVRSPLGSMSWFFVFLKPRSSPS